MDEATGTAATRHLVDALSQSSAYTDSPLAPVIVHETHISWVFVVGDYAYKVKKPIKTPFLDYRTLEERRRLCHEELRLDSRFAHGLYLDVVPITFADGSLRVNGSGRPIEYALKMRRFESDALLSQRLLAGRISEAEIVELADALATFHRQATPCGAGNISSPQNILQEALDNFTELQPLVTGEPASMLRSLQIWTRDGFEQFSDKMTDRGKEGYVRECHGDLHLGNIVHWGGRYVPFDGIEFSSALRNIDVLNDLAFLSMDLAAHQRNDLRHLLVSAYVEHDDDREALDLFRWYEVYRALVRAKVDSLRAQQFEAAGGDPDEARRARDAHILVAHHLTDSPPPTLTITHGPSGSGKSTVSELWVARVGAIRVRADVERKRHFGLSPTARPDENLKLELYSTSASAITYAKLLATATQVLEAGFPVVLDATYLKHQQRRAAFELASRLGIGFGILDCFASPNELRQRLTDRRAAANDASDADLQVLANQLDNSDPLDEVERRQVIEFPAAQTSRDS